MGALQIALVPEQRGLCPAGGRLCQPAQAAATSATWGRAGHTSRERESWGAAFSL